MHFNRLVVVFLVAIALTGCASSKKPLLPAHDEVLVYPLAYDLTFLKTMEALMSIPGWDMEITDKESGLIRVRNIDYTGLDDSDQRLATFVLKRVARGETSIELEKGSQQVFGVKDLMKAISTQLNREVQI